MSPFQKTFDFEKCLKNILVINNSVLKDQKTVFAYLNKFGGFEKYKEIIFEFYSTKLTTYTMSLHAYIIGIVSHTTCVVCVNFIHK